VIFSKINVRNFENIPSGAGNIKADGASDNVKLTISGFGNFEAPGTDQYDGDVRILARGMRSCA
jgi:hypothetical protein